MFLRITAAHLKARVCVCVMCVYVCVCVSEDHLAYHSPSDTVHFVVWNRISPWKLGLTKSAGVAGRWPPEILPMPSPGIELQMTAITHCIFTWALGIKLRSHACETNTLCPISSAQWLHFWWGQLCSPSTAVLGSKLPVETKGEKVTSH